MRYGPHTEETKQKISQGLKGKKFSAEHIARITATRKRLFQEGKLISWNKGKKGLQQGIKGERNPLWKGGYFIDKNGYRYVLGNGHPNCQKDGYILEHRLVMSQVLGRPLMPFEAFIIKMA